MDALKNLLHSRLRNQLSNVLLFGSMIALTGIGIVAGAVSGLLLAGRTAVHDLPPIFQLGTVLLFTVTGFAAGVFASVGASPWVLRYAFFATRIGEWSGVAVYSARDEDLPGRLPNVFVAGFARAWGPFRPVIFVAEGALRALKQDSLEAVFAHELSHLDCRHLSRRLFRAVGVFLLASFLTSITLIGLHWSGYTGMGGAFSVVAGILPALLTWMAIGQMGWEQEFEADEAALRNYGVAPEALLSALIAMQKAIGGEAHPLVSARMDSLRQKIVDLAATAPRPVFSDESRVA